MSKHLFKRGANLTLILRLKAWLALLVLGGVASLSVAGASLAHEVRPALLQITEQSSGAYEVVWKQPVVGDMAIRLVPRLSSGALTKTPPRETHTQSYLIKAWQVPKGQPLDGQTVTIDGLAQTVTDVLVRVEAANGHDLNAVLKPSSPSMVLALSGPKGASVPTYLTLGIEHILTGFDHLLFVLGLLLLVGVNRQIIKAVTAFTLAHSITLAVAALGFVKFPTALIEALIALSIVFVASELVPRHGRAPTLTQRYPWVVAFIFGLLHGLGFAGALAQIGLPPGAAPQALFLFNVGVEIGQLAFIAAAIAVILILRRVRARLAWPTDTLARLAPPYLIGSLAAYWLIERTLAAYS